LRRKLHLHPTDFKAPRSWNRRGRRMIDTLLHPPSTKSELFPKELFISNFKRLKSVLGHLNPDTM